MKKPRAWLRPCFLVGSNRKNLAAFSESVRGDIGHALHEAQSGLEPLAVKALKGFGGRSILEIVDDFDGNTYRAVYTVRFTGAIYVLHAFQKKSVKGAETPKREIELIVKRLRDAEEHYKIWIATKDPRL